jgi:DNA-binding transcriptional MerR regulator
VFKISDFSKLSQVSMRALRYYDEIGLLKPVQVDTFTGYRYYSVEQLSRLHRILELKDMGFELAQIVQLLDEEVPAEQLCGMLRLKLLEIQQRVLAEQERQARVEARLKQLELDEARPTHEVALKKVKPQLVASSRTTVANFALKNQFANDMLNFLKQNGVRQIDHLVFIELDSRYADNDLSIIEVVVPIQSSSIGNIVERSGGRITIRELPGVNTAATLLYQGSPYTLTEAYQSLGTWIAANDYAIPGPCRQVCLQREGNLDSYLTEIQFPVEKKEVANSKHPFYSGKRSTTSELEVLHSILS